MVENFTISVTDSRQGGGLINMKIKNNTVILTSEEYTALINEFNALQHKYGDICDRYRLCKDANETIKQHAVMVRKETEEKYQARIDELEKEVDMLIKEQKQNRSYEIEQSCTERTREILKYLMQFEGYAAYAGEELAEKYGVEEKGND